MEQSLFNEVGVTNFGPFKLETEEFDIPVGNRHFSYLATHTLGDEKIRGTLIKTGEDLGSFIEQYVCLLESKQKSFDILKGVFLSLLVGVVVAFLYWTLWTKVFGFEFTHSGDELLIYCGFIGASSLVFEFFKIHNGSSGSMGCLGLIALLFAPMVVGLISLLPGMLIHSYLDWFPDNAFWLIVLVLPIIQLVIIVISLLIWVVNSLKLRKLKQNHYKKFVRTLVVRINEILDELGVNQRYLLSEDFALTEEDQA